MKWLFLVVVWIIYRIKNEQEIERNRRDPLMIFKCKTCQRQLRMSEMKDLSWGDKFLCTKHKPNLVKEVAKR